MDTTTLETNFQTIELADTVYKRENTLFAILAVLSGLLWLGLLVGTMGIILIYLLLFFLAYLFAHSAFISYLSGNAVEITAEQYPDLHQRLLDCCQRLQMAEVPKAYLMASDGVLNALATRFLWRNYVVLYSSIVDALESKPESINFYIGHELGHLRRNHLGKGPLIAPFAWLPLLGPAYARAKEYTCDLHGLRCCNSLDAATNAIAVLAAGSQQWKRLNLNQYLQQVQHSSGFWMSYHELANDYPWLSKRMAQVYARGQGQLYQPPGRNGFAYLFAFFTPRTYGAAGGMLLMVMILGILAAAAIPIYKDYQMRTFGGGNDSSLNWDQQTDQNSQANSSDTSAEQQEPSNPGDPEQAQQELAAQISSLQPVMDAMLNHYKAKQQWPSAIEELGLDPDLLQSFPSLTLYADGVLGFTGSESLGDYQPNSIYLEPQQKAGSTEFEWVCYSPDIPDNYLPENCRG